MGERSRVGRGGKRENSPRYYLFVCGKVIAMEGGSDETKEKGRRARKWEGEEGVE
jgi:hypothetical protein